MVLLSPIHSLFYFEWLVRDERCDDQQYSDLCTNYIICSAEQEDEIDPEAIPLDVSFFKNLRKNPYTWSINKLSIQ